MKKQLAVLAIVTALTACTDPDGARKALLDDGVEPSDIGGYAWFQCGRDDLWATRFKGERSGRKISGAVCSGIFKGHTLRYD
jgi:hypothetical protein